MSDVRFMEYRSPGQFIGWPGSGGVGGGDPEDTPSQHPPICCSDQGPENLDMSCRDSGNPHRDDDSVQSLSYKLFFHEGYFTQITNAWMTRICGPYRWFVNLQMPQNRVIEVQRKATRVKWRLVNRRVYKKNIKCRSLLGMRNGNLYKLWRGLMLV